MVVFACNACGASVKKNQVEKHYQQQCRRCESLSCMDCGKDFWGEEYKQHNKCITEEAKYAAKGWEPKASANKGERKQEAWIETINRAVANATDMAPGVRDLLGTITQHSNIPRKKKKFDNFVCNSIRVRNRLIVDEAWKVFEAAIAKEKEEDSSNSVASRKGKETAHDNQENRAQDEMPDNLSKKKKKKSNSEPHVQEAENEDAPLAKKSKREKKMERSKKKNKGETSVPSINGVKGHKRKTHEDEQEENEDPQDDEPRVSKKKRKLDDDQIVERLNDTLDESTLASAQASKKFDWTGVVLALLGNRADHELTLKKLRKKVISEYECRGCEGKPNTSKEEVWAKLDKKLKKMPQVRVIKDSVKLVSV